MFFLAVNSREFNDLRIEIQPDFPEHAGIGIYDAGSLTPILPIASTDKNFERWWPIKLDEAVDCQAQGTCQVTYGSEVLRFWGSEVQFTQRRVAAPGPSASPRFPR